jgi:MarR family transcriptional regulator, lower aerobic nicotinate degradation pathway regulator
VDSLAQLSFLVQATLGDLAAQHDLSMTQTRLLGVLRDREPTMNQLGRLLDLDKSSVSGLVDRAERRGLVQRVSSDSDRRVFRVSITPAGRTLVDLVAAQFADQVSVLTGHLSRAEQRTLSTVASRIVVASAERHGIDL